MPYVVRKLNYTRKAGKIEGSIDVTFSAPQAANEKCGNVTSKLIFVDNSRSNSDTNQCCETKYTFSVIVSQTGRQLDHWVAFILFESNKIYKTRNDAFPRIRYTLTPLLSSGEIILSKTLLCEVILPEPLDPRLIGSQLVDLLEYDPEGQHQWHSVIQVLNNYKDIDQLPAANAMALKGEVLSFKEYYEATSSHQLKLKMKRAGILGSHLLPLIAVPTAAIEATEFDDRQTSRKIFRLASIDGVKSHNSTQSRSSRKTWLMESVEKEHMRSSLYLALSGVDPNDRHVASGDTALHIAARLGNLDLVKLLLACNADPTIANRKMQTPFDISQKLTSKNAKEICSVLEKTIALRTKAKSYYDAHCTLPKADKASDRERSASLLALDGGGVRVTMMGVTIARIEERMKELDPNSQPIQSYFDYIAGTSGGAGLAAGMLYRNESVTNSSVVVLECVHEVMTKPLVERQSSIRKFYEDLLGKSTVMSDLENGNIIITSAIATVSPNVLHLMTNYGDARDSMPGPNERKLVDAVIASSAAPGFFPAFENTFLDGGVICVNPTITAMVDIYRKWEKEGNAKQSRIGLVVSMGAGIVPSKIVDNIEVFVPNYYNLSSIYSSAFGLKNLFTHFMEQTMQADGLVVEQAKTWCQSIGASYYRLSPPLEKHILLDTTDLSELIELLFAAQIYVLENHVMIDEIAKNLLLSKDFRN